MSVLNKLAKMLVKRRNGEPCPRESHLPRMIELAQEMEQKAKGATNARSGRTTRGIASARDGESQGMP